MNPSANERSVYGTWTAITQSNPVVKCRLRDRARINAGFRGSGICPQVLDGLIVSEVAQMSRCRGSSKTARLLSLVRCKSLRRDLDRPPRGRAAAS